jgi:hypothetical protein
MHQAERGCDASGGKWRGGAPHQKDDGCERARPGEQREGEGKDRDVGTVMLDLPFFRRGRPTNAGFAGENHLGGEQEKKYAASDAESWNCDAQRRQQPIAYEREDEQQ